MQTPSPRWHLVQEPLPNDILQQGRPLLEPLQVQLFANRDITDIATMQLWKQGDFSASLDPFTLPHMSEAVNRIIEAINKQENICIIGDCDVDGLAATALLTQGLQIVGAVLTAAIIMPRTEDGRGLTMTTARMAIDRKATLCITVDNGSGSVQEANYLADNGIDLIITDHHHVAEPSPIALALVNPQLHGSTYANMGIAGSGVALQLARAVLMQLGEPDATWHVLLDLAGMGTVADIVPITLENRFFMRQGLKRLNVASRPGITALLALSARSSRFIPPPALTFHDISYRIGPRLNAAGRMADPTIALELLLTADPVEATRLANELDQLNQERQRQTEIMVQEATILAQQQIDTGEPMIFVSQEGWSVGLVGLVAGRLADRFQRLAAVVAITPEGCRGSLRGPASFHIAETLATMVPPLREAGGHARAGGFATTRDQLSPLHSHLLAAYNQPRSVVTIAEDVAVDAVIPLSRISPMLLEQVRALAPFGPGFSEPTFVTTHVTITRSWPFSSDTHVRFAAAELGQQRLFFWRNGMHDFRQLPLNTLVDVIWSVPATSMQRGNETEATVITVIPTS